MKGTDQIRSHIHLDEIDLFVYVVQHIITNQVSCRPLEITLHEQCHFIMSGTAEAGTRHERLNTVSHSIYSRRQKTTLSQPADSQDNYAMSPHSAHCRHDQRRYYKRLAPPSAKHMCDHCVYESKGQLTAKAVGWRACMTSKTGALRP